MSEDRRKILEMIAAGTISPEEGEKLLDALGSSETKPTGIPSGKSADKSLYIDVKSKDSSEKKDKVHIRIPFSLLKAGINIMALLPRDARENIDKTLKDKKVDFDLNNISSENVQEIMAALEEVSIDVEDDDNFVRIYCR